MLFNSLDFGIFFIIVTLAYFALPYRFRWILLTTNSGAGSKAMAAAEE